MRTLLAISGAVLLAVSGCGGGDGMDAAAPAPTTPPPAAPPPLQFTNFVTAQYTATATGETLTPFEVDTTVFSFTDEDPTAFDVVIAAAP